MTETQSKDILGAVKETPDGHLLRLLRPTTPIVRDDAVEASTGTFGRHY